MKSFATYHPLVLMIYFVAVIAVLMFAGNPVLLVLAVFGGFLFNLMTETGVKVIRNLLFYILFFALIAVTNPLFSHNGVTVLFFINSNAYTLEAVYYGMGIGTMLVGMMYWFVNYSLTVTSEKFLFLFGKIIPKLSLVFSMVLRFIPHFRKQIVKVGSAQKAMGLYSRDNYVDKIRSGARVFSIMVTWALENSIETADAMKARGYGLPGRSHFSIFKFGKRDGVLMALIAVLAATVFIGIGTDMLAFSYYPKISGLNTGVFPMFAYTAYGLLVFLPAIIEIKERIKWKYFLSKI
jgi:energy-coupling factor transport system permease protein